MDLIKQLFRTFLVFLFVHVKVLAYHSNGIINVKDNAVRRQLTDTNDLEISINSRRPGNPTSDETESAGDEVSRCPKCAFRREQVKQFRIEQIKQVILKTLNMVRVPNTTLNNVPAEVNRLITEFPNGGTNMQGDEPLYSQSSETSTIEQIFLFPKRPTQEWGNSDPTFFSFQFADKLFEYNVKEALLHIHIHRASNIPGAAHYVVVNRVFPRSDDTKKPKIKFNVDRKVSIDSERGQWVVINVTHIAQEWLQSQGRSHILQIQLVDDSNNPLNHLLDTDVDINHQKRPYMKVSVKKRQQTRTTRSTDEDICTEDNPRDTCCMYPLTIDFEQIEWDWILVPRSFEANYCDGSCPLSHRPHYSHTYLTSSLRSLNLAGTGPCCSPSSTNGIQMLYFDDNENIQLSTVPNMSVHSCHCS